nr:hypothetical protein [Tanacetum cinerariifolium]
LKTSPGANAWLGVNVSVAVPPPLTLPVYLPCRCKPYTRRPLAVLREIACEKFTVTGAVRITDTEADIPQARHQDALGGALDKVGCALGAALHDEAAGVGQRRNAGFLRPIARAVQVLHHALFNPGRALLRATIAREREVGNLGVSGVRVDGYALVKKLLALAVAATFLAEEAASFVGRAGVERPHQGT